MRRLLAFGISLLACSEWRMKPTFPEEAAGRPVVQEQAIVGLSADGDAAVADLTDADGQPPRLALLFLDRAGARTDLVAPPELAAAVARELESAGRKPQPLLQPLVAARWPQAVERAADLGYFARPPSPPEPGRERWELAGAAELGAIPLSLRLDASETALVLLLSERPGGDGSDEVELARLTLGGAPLQPQLFVQGGAAWLVGGAVHPSRVLHRTVAVRRASIARGEAELHNGHGLADYAAGDLDAARREFDRAIAADPAFVDGLYNAASAAALSDREEDAVALLRRAANVDLARVQVLGRNDEDLKVLRKRADVRALLGLKRPPREDIPPPP
ncbi:MAG TPA: hypothetical protein VLW85_23065 [Myxococcales bacterium]|nr:hypothetical protein [Myxococcales bacterium]